MMVPRPFARRPRPASPLRASRCFATTPDGRIPLRSDWGRLLDVLTACSDCALQTRHATARLVRLGRLPFGVPGLGRLSDARTQLEFSYPHWHRADARIRLCPCCDSPGRIEIRDLNGAEFLQLCAPAGLSPTAWVDLIAPLVDDTLDRLLDDDDSAGEESYPPPNLQVRRGPARGVAATELASFLAAWGDADRSVAITLSTAAVRHTEVFRPTAVRCNGPLLHAWGEGITLQVALNTAVRLQPDSGTPHPCLQIIDSQGRVLVSARPDGNCPEDVDAWSAAVAALFAR